MDKESIKVLRNNLLVFIAYILLSFIRKDGWALLGFCIFTHLIYCLSLAIGEYEGLPQNAYWLCFFIILLIGCGTCTYLFSSTAFSNHHY
jgi:hypothetical protein